MFTSRKISECIGPLNSSLKSVSPPVAPSQTVTLNGPHIPANIIHHQQCKRQPLQERPRSRDVPFSSTCCQYNDISSKMHGTCSKKKVSNCVVFQLLFLSQLLFLVSLSSCMSVAQSVRVSRSLWLASLFEHLSMGQADNHTL